MYPSSIDLALTTLLLWSTMPHYCVHDVISHWIRLVSACEHNNGQSNHFLCTYILILWTDSLASDMFNKLKHYCIDFGCWDIHWNGQLPIKKVHTSVDILWRNMPASIQGLTKLISHWLNLITDTMRVYLLQLMDLSNLAELLDCASMLFWSHAS